MGLFVTCDMKPTMEKITKPANMLVHELMQHTMMESLGRGNVKYSLNWLTLVLLNWSSLKNLKMRSSLLPVLFHCSVLYIYMQYFLIVNDINIFPFKTSHQTWPLSHFYRYRCCRKLDPFESRAQNAQNECNYFLCNWLFMWPRTMGLLEKTGFARIVLFFPPAHTPTERSCLRFLLYSCQELTFITSF